jgi:threonine synthase
VGEVVAASVVLPDREEPLAVDDLDSLLSGTWEHQVDLAYEYDSALLLPTPNEAFDMWRYSALLPLSEGPIRYPLQVGGTPLLASPRLRGEVGLSHLWLKDETRGPTGSNKDRATALVVEHALRTGIETVSCASTGNVAVSLAVGAAAADLGAVVFVPADVAEAKLRLMLAAGATVLKVREGYERAFALSREAARRFGWCDRNTGLNPLTVEAKKTVAFETWEQLGRRVPDVVVVPVGDGVTLAALLKGFRELVRCGVAERLPRVIGVQAEGCQPLRLAWLDAGARAALVDEPRTIADGIAVAAPVSAPAVLRDLRETGGAMVAVPDDAMLAAISRLARAGVFAEPAGAAAFAGLQPALAAGLLGEEESVVALVTGTGLKTPQHLRDSGRVREVHARMDDVESALGR